MNLRLIIGSAFLVVVAIFLVFSALLTHPFGHPEEQYFTEDETAPLMDEKIIRDTQTETGADNSVTAVVFDYRGFDTLGEATVLFTAVAGVIILFRRLKK
jgi:multisubunit Na+/H+ antiporter MnhB subunit